ncbi:hypothetical protein B0H14DRAFT_2222915, partial [Mycena olivaceomarginata]
TQRPSRYCWSDYGLANKKPGTHLVPYVRGGDKDIPAVSRQIHPDPFVSDVWNLLLSTNQIIQRYSGLKLLSPLVPEMYQENPGERPTINLLLPTL